MITKDLTYWIWVINYYCVRIGSLVISKETGGFIDLHTVHSELHWTNQAMLKVRNFDCLVYHKVVRLSTLGVTTPKDSRHSTKGLCTYGSVIAVHRYRSFIII